MPTTDIRPPQNRDPQRYDRIVTLFAQGFSRAEIVEEGELEGTWTANDVAAVPTSRGWRLDPAGRLPLPDRVKVAHAQKAPSTTPVPPAAPTHAQQAPSTAKLSAAFKGAYAVSREQFIREADVHELLGLADGYSNARIQRLAGNVRAHVWKLREALLAAVEDDKAQAERDEARRRLEELEEERQKLLAIVKPAGGSGKKRGMGAPRPLTGEFKHGGMAGWLTHLARHEEPCTACQEGKDEQVRRMQAGRGKKQK